MNTLNRRQVGQLAVAAVAGRAMGAVPEICLLGAAEMARRIRAKQLSAREARC